MKNYHNICRSHFSLLMCVLALAGCGGSGSTASVAKVDTVASAPKAADTPMAALVVPVSMKWGTTSVFALGFNVKDSAGAPAAGVPVSLHTFTTVSLEDGSPVEEPVALDQIDNSITDVNGVATFSARVPGYLTELLVVSSKGSESAKKVITMKGDMPSVTITLGL